MSLTKVTKVIMVISLVTLQTLPVWACAPAFREAVMFNTLRPDLPLKGYAAGNIGVIQGSWAKSYLCVAYRYLINSPLSGSEQKSICPPLVSQIGKYAHRRRRCSNKCHRKISQFKQKSIECQKG
jgi:hypothetical protein